MELLKKARIRLLLAHPFFASILLNTRMVEDKTISTACTNGKQIRYNPDYFKKLGMEGTMFVLCHEVLHIAFLHTTRINNRKMDKWNIACDYAINPILVEANLRMPEGGLMNPIYSGKSAEEIYNLLPDSECKGGGGMGEVEKGYTTETEKEQLEQEIKQMVSSAAAQAKKQGNLPGSLEELIDAVLEPTVSWKEILYQFVCEIAKNDYTWKMPNPRYLSSGIYLPSFRSEEVGNIIMFIDTSASVDKDQLNQFAGELQSILQHFNMGFTIIYVDTEVSHVQEVEPDDVLQLEVKGRGGTCFIPAFEYVEQHGLEPKCAIYFTDGQCSSFPPTPDYPTLWACTDREFDAAFGQTVFVDTTQQVKLIVEGGLK